MAIRWINENTQVLNEGINNKTLKEVMISLAKIIYPNKIHDGEKWVIHHLDYDNSNNNIENISLMLYGKHQSFHVNARNKHLSNLQKDEFLNDNYENYIIRIGPYLANLLQRDGQNSEVE